MTTTSRRIRVGQGFAGCVLALALGALYGCGAAAEDELDDVEDVQGELAEPDTVQDQQNLGTARQALMAVDPDDPGGNPRPQSRCFEGLTGSFTASAYSIHLGDTVTLRWSVKAPTGCSTIRYYLGNTLVSASGSSVVQPMANTTYSLRAVLSGIGQGSFGSAPIAVSLPQSVTISANNQAALLAQALATPYTNITVQNQVALDLSYRTLQVAQGVVLRGGRTPRDPGPVLYSSAPYDSLLNIAGDNVRITGLRIQGPDMGVPDGDTPKAITNTSYLNLEVDNNELYGWTGAAVAINDDYERIDYFDSPTMIRIHDNYIHHNQHEGRFGYGVVIGNGAYAKIKRNVFDWNRHAIAGDGSDGSGYIALENLVLKNGGLHRWLLGAWTHTHQFDMHGQDNCGIWDIFSDALYNCGTAGHDMLIRYNTFLYTEGNAIKLRGTPQLQPVGAFVGNNVFAHDSFGDAVSQTESGLRDEGGNRFDIDGSARLGSCDLDADGVLDTFMATGQTWWYSSRGEMPWSYLNTSTKLLHEVQLGDFNGDNRCDVVADGVVYSGGKPASPRFHGPILPIDGVFLAQ